MCSRLWTVQLEYLQWLNIYGRRNAIFRTISLEWDKDLTGLQELYSQQTGRAKSTSVCTSGISTNNTVLLTLYEGHLIISKMQIVNIAMCFLFGNISTSGCIYVWYSHLYLYGKLLGIIMSLTQDFHHTDSEIICEKQF